MVKHLDLTRDSSLRKYTDWRQPEYRKELFFRYCKWRLKVYDLDHTHYYKFFMKGKTRSQKCWYAFLFGMTYRTPQAYAYWYHFKDIEEVTAEEVIKWNKDNWKRCTYGTDARYNKGHFAKQVISILEWKGEGTLLDKVLELVDEFDDPEEAFENLFASIATIYKYGRMTSWLACQCLFDLLDLPMDFSNILIRSPVNDSSIQSVWNGYCTLRNKPEMFLGTQYGQRKYKLSTSDLTEVIRDLKELRNEFSETTGISIDIFKWESVWCQYKRLFNPNQSKEYPGHASGDAVSRYLYYRKHWPEIDWSQFRRALLTQESMIKGMTYVNKHNQVFGTTGLLLNMHEMYPDMPNAYKVLNIDPNQFLVRELFSDSGKVVPSL